MANIGPILHVCWVIQSVLALAVTSWRVGHPQPIQKLCMLLEQVCIIDLTLSITSIERGPSQNPAQIRHLRSTIKQQVCTPNYNITVALGRAAMHFLKLQLTVHVVH